MTPPELIDRFRTVRDMTEQLAAPLSPEDQLLQSMPDASPTKWHRAHTTWFFETFILVPFSPAYEVVDERYSYLFNSYYDAVGRRHPRPERGLISRPSNEEVTAYRHEVDRQVIELLECGVPEEIGAIVDLGLNHEQQHQELLLMDIRHALGHPSVSGAYGAVPWDRTGVGRLGWCAHPGGQVDIGAGREGFSFDNEGPRHEVTLRPFEISTSLVTVDEVIAFIDDAGYERPDLWMAEGFGLIQEGGRASPSTWTRIDGAWWSHTLGGLAPLDGSTAATNLSWFEADAIARWLGGRLPTEAEWEVCAPPADGPGIAGWFGEVWQWTASPYVAYPGFTPGPGAIGEYNGKFMVNQMVLRGSSLATPPGHARRTYRNFFPTSSDWVFAGLRLARDN